jgi:hypothetical protein
VDVQVLKNLAQAELFYTELKLKLKIRQPTKGTKSNKSGIRGINPTQA